MAVDRDALLCDLAEAYGIFDFRALPVHTLAALCFGLRDNSRIKMKLAGMQEIPQTILLAAIADNLSAIRYYLTAKKGDKKPGSFIEELKAPAQKVRKGLTIKQKTTFALIRADVESRMEVVGGG